MTQRAQTVSPRFRWIALLLGAALLAGCQGPYVNIPASSGDMAAHDPNGSMVRNVVTTALSRAVEELQEQQGVDGPVMVVLPEGTSKLTYATVLPEISENAIAPDEEGAEPAAEVRTEAVRVRGGSGEVEVRQKIGETPAQIKTVYMNWSVFSGWRVQRTRLWTYPVD